LHQGLQALLLVLTPFGAGCSLSANIEDYVAASAGPTVGEGGAGGQAGTVSHLIVMGGWLPDELSTSPSQKSADVLIAPFNPDGTVGKWRYALPLPQRLWSPVGFVQGSSLGAIGKANSVVGGPVGFTAPLQAAQPVSWSWTIMTEIGCDDSTCKKEYAGAVSASTLFISGGGTDTDAYDQVWSASLDDLELLEQNTPLSAGRYQHTSTTYDEFVYVLGGYTRTTAPDPVALDDIQVAKRDPSTGQLGPWQTAGTMPVDIGTSVFPEHAPIAIDGTLYIVGGRDTAQVHRAAIDPATGTLGNFEQDEYENLWLDEPLVGHAVATHEGYIYVVGGRDENWEYQRWVQYAEIKTDGSLGKFQRTTDLPVGRAFTAAVAFSP